MARPKTRPTESSVTEFLNGIGDKQKRADCKVIAQMMREATGKRPKMWGASMVGYGSYRYRYASGRDGEWFECGFSPRAQNITVYIMPGFRASEPLLKKLGKHKTGKSCLYIKRLDDVDQTILSRLIADSVDTVRRKYGSR